MGLFGKNEKESVATIELKPSEVVPTEPVKPPSPTNNARYTVQDAIVLMRQLPSEPNSLPLVVQVVRSTLASLNVKVEDIIKDAQVRERSIEDRVLRVRAEISELEKEIASRRQQINELEADLSETVSVRERLEMSDAASSNRIAHPPAPPAKPAAAASAPNGSPAATGTRPAR